MKSNEWLTNNDFLQKVEFKNKYYFQSLCIYIDNFIKNIPIPVITTWDYKYQQIYFTVGQESKSFKIDVNIAYRDYITLVRRWIEQFYPKYEIEVEGEIILEDEKEILDRVKKGMKLNDAICKKGKVKETGIIEKVFFMEDKFIVNINGNRFLRMCGTEETVCPISKFLPELRKIKGDVNKKKYIFENSIEIREIEKKQEIWEINYFGFQMKNFVEINYSDLKKEEFKQLDVRKWQWGNYILNIETNILENDIIEFLKKKKIIIKLLKEN